MLTPDQAVDAYIAMWNAVDEGRRQEFANRALTGDAVLLYPSLEVHGRDEAVAAGERYHRDAPGFRIVLRSGVEQHHGRVRVAWHMVYADGSLGPEGQSVGELADDGRLRCVIGFHDPLPSSRDPASRQDGEW